MQKDRVRCPTVSHLCWYYTLVYVTMVTVHMYQNMQNGIRIFDIFLLLFFVTDQATRVLCLFFFMHILTISALKFSALFHNKYVYCF